MDELFKQKLADYGADVEGTLHRFMGNGALYFKFLNKLKDDTNFASLKENLEQENYEEAFKAAHTLKGVTANLGLTPLCEIASAMTELMRGKEESQIDKEQMAEQMKQLEEKYHSFLQLIDGNN